jgi:valyl-tRNA synthetase
MSEKPKYEKMSKSRGNVVCPEEVVYGVHEIDKRYEFRGIDGKVIDWKELGVWQDKLNTHCFFTSKRYDRQPVWLCLRENGVPCVLEVDGRTIIQHEDLRPSIDEQA